MLLSLSYYQIKYFRLISIFVNDYFATVYPIPSEPHVCFKL